MNGRSSLRADAINSVIAAKQIPLGILYQEKKPTYSDLVVRDKKLVEFDKLREYFK